MSNQIPTMFIVDAQTGETFVRDLTADELAENKAYSDQVKNEEEAKTAARESALAKLAALGLTAEEIAAL
jgi:DNA-binding NarL/FixJ family response regulator